MQVQVTGHHIEVTPPLRAYITEKLHKVARHFDHAVSARAVLTVVKLRQRAEATINVGVRGKTIYATETSNDMYAAIDGLIDKLDRQVLRHKDKLTDHYREDRHAANN
jgi:putative sigma-54 modulation protein